MDTRELDRGKMVTGVVGLGLMGCSIVVALLAAGHEVRAVAPLADELPAARERVRTQLGLFRKGNHMKNLLYDDLRLIISDDYSILADCQLIQECVIEDLEIKKNVYRQITAVTGVEAIISSNTSAIPISILQQYVAFPERFLGIHWAEPAFATRFLEITCGIQTNQGLASSVYRLAHSWGKEPTLLKKDIRGFITNRLMYAVYREALSLVENGDASLEDADKAFRYDAGSWMTMMGIFRRMDFEGVRDHHRVLKRLLPELSKRKTIPSLMQQMVDQHARGIQDNSGLYTYSGQEAQQWADAFAVFSREIDQLAAAYPAEDKGNDFTYLHH